MRMTMGIVKVLADNLCSAYRLLGFIHGARTTNLFQPSPFDFITSELPNGLRVQSIIPTDNLEDQTSQKDASVLKITKVQLVILAIAANTTYSCCHANVLLANAATSQHRSYENYTGHHKHVDDVTLGRCVNQETSQNNQSNSENLKNNEKEKG